MARPMPRPPPVTSACFPSSEAIFKRIHFQAKPPSGLLCGNYFRLKLFRLQVPFAAPSLGFFPGRRLEARMKVHVVGGVPAGLYFAILMKKAWPQTRITVFERNKPDDTFGFGVVFSDQTLTGFEAYDLETYRQIVG